MNAGKKRGSGGKVGGRSRVGVVGRPAPVRGRVRIVRKARGREETLTEAPVELPPGKRVFTIRAFREFVISFTSMLKRRGTAGLFNLSVGTAAGEQGG